MNRKGRAAADTLPWILRIIAAMILLVLLVAQIKLITGQKPEITGLEETLYLTRILNGPHGILFTDPLTDRDRKHPAPGIVDLQMFNPQNQQLDLGYTEPTGLERYAARLRLYDKAKLIGGEQPYRELFHHQERFKTYAPLAQAGLTGKGGATYQKHVVPVVVRDGKSGTYKDKIMWLQVEMVRVT